MQSREDRIRAKAHELWEAEGRPGDRAENHWTEAERLIDAEDSRRAIDIAPSPEGDIHPTGGTGFGGRR